MTQTRTIDLGGFMSRRFAEGQAGKKFRAQVRRRAQTMSDADGSSVEVRDENGRLVDYLTGPHEYSEVLRTPLPEDD